jgi:type VI secretion system FHA domain protein
MVLILTIIRYKNLPPTHTLSARIGDAGGTIGRSADNDLALPDSARWVSAQHAEIQCRDGRFFLIDKSANGTFINHVAEPVPKGQEIELHDGDELTICAYEVRVSFETEQPQPEGAFDPFAGGRG